MTELPNLNGALKKIHMFTTPGPPLKMSTKSPVSISVFKQPSRLFHCKLIVDLNKMLIHIHFLPQIFHLTLLTCMLLLFLFILLSSFFVIISCGCKLCTKSQLIWYWPKVSGHSLIKKVNGFVQDCSISIADALDILQSCTKPSKWYG